MEVDAFYIVNELFNFSAFSISQFLNLLASKIQEDTGYSSMRHSNYDISSLLYQEDILDELVGRLRDNISAIQTRPHLSWPGATAETHRTIADTASQKLLMDFENLLERANVLRARCNDGVSRVMNRASIMESKRAIAQAERVEQLSFLAYLFIPLSLITSFFGMNLGVVGEGTLPLWVFFAAGAPAVIGSLILVKGLSIWKARSQYKKKRN